MSTHNQESKKKVSGGFWRSSAVRSLPGKTNVRESSKDASSSSSMLSSNNSKNNFKVYEASVSDAWDSSLEPTSPSNESVDTKQLMVQDLSVSKSNLSTSSSLSTTPSVSKESRMSDLLSTDPVDLSFLRRLSWSGVPVRLRPSVWKTLCGFLPPTADAEEREGVRSRKREEYLGYVRQYFHNRDEDVHGETYRQIHIDVPRMSPVIALFQQECVQQLFERVLYIWAIRHPASGYVQGINDLLTPFFLVFLQELKPDQTIDVNDPTFNVAETFSEHQLDCVEADSFWCLSRVLSGIQDHYTFAQPGIQLKVRQLEELVSRVDVELHSHLRRHEVLYLQFSFRWMNNILMRELPIAATIRLWDTYLSELEGFSHFHLYVCAAFLIHWKQELLKRDDFHTLLMFLQNLPTAKWGDNDIELVVAEAFRLSYIFADAPKHFAS